MGGEPVQRGKLGAAQTLGPAAYFGYDGQILAHDAGRMRIFAENESVENKNFPRGGGVDSAVIAALAVGDDESVERNALDRADESRRRVPSRIAPTAFRNVPGGGDYPARIDDRDGARVEPRRLDKFAGDDPFRMRLLQDGRRMHRKSQSVGSAVVQLLVVEASDASEKPGKQRAVERVGSAVVVFRVQPHAPGERAELPDEFAPLSQLRIRQIVFLGELPQLRLRKRLALRVPPAPQFQDAEKIRILDAELRVGLGCLFAFIDRAPPRVVASHRGDDRQGRRQRGQSGSGDKHPGEARLERHCGEAASDRRQDRRAAALFASDRAEFEKLFQALPHHDGAGRIYEREFLDFSEAQIQHRQDDAGERRAEDFRRGVRLSGRVILFRIKADAAPWRDASAPSETLSGGRLRDRFDLEALDVRAVDVSRYPGESGIDNGFYARDRKRRFGDVRREHDAPARECRERAREFRGRKRSEKRDGLVADEARIAGKEGGGFPYVALAGEEHEHVVVRRERCDRGGDVARQVALFAVRRRHIDCLDGIHAARDGHDAGAAEKGGEASGIKRRRRDDDSQVAAFFQNALQDAEEEIDVEGPLVGFVDYYRAVSAQERIAPRFGEKHAVRHEFDFSLGRDLLLVAVAVSDDAADGRAEFGRDASGDGNGGDAARLGAGDDAAAFAATCGYGEFRELGGLSGSGVAADDQNAPGFQERDDFAGVG